MFSKRIENRVVDKRLANVVNDESNVVGKVLAIFGQSEGLIEAVRHDAAKGIHLHYPLTPRKFFE